jgi:hypothetical protein
VPAVSQFTALQRAPKVTYVPVVDDFRCLAAVPGARELILAFGGSLARLSVDDGRLQPIENTLTDRWGDPARLSGLVVTESHELVAADVSHLWRATVADGVLRAGAGTPTLSDCCTAGSMSVASDARGGVMAVCANDYLVRVVDGVARNVHEPDNHFWGVALTADGSLLACGRNDGTVELRDPVSLDVRRTLAGLGACILSLRFSPSGRTLVAGDDRTGLCSWDLESGRPRSHELGVKATDISWLPDESGFLVTGLTRVVGLFTPDEEFGEHVWFDNLNVRYFQGAALVDEHTLAVRLEESRRPEEQHPDVPEPACVMIIDFGAAAG